MLVIIKFQNQILSHLHLPQVIIKGEDYHAGYYKVPEPNPEPPLPPTGNYQMRGLSCWLL